MGAAVAGTTMGAAGGFAAGITGTMLNGGTFRQALENGVKGAATGAIMGAISGGFGSSWNMERVMVNGMGGGVSSEIMGGRFEDGFKVAFLTAAAAYAYNSVTTQIGKEYPQQNTNNGQNHILQNGKNNVGMDRPGVTDFRSDQHWGMKLIGKLPTMDSFAEFHDSLLDKVKFLESPGLNELSMIPAFGVNFIATYHENYTAFEVAQYVNENK